ncbi:hypothetical protein B0H14DRAFT_3132165 [Mycena olivaceomarginata]|nr:hypothetical protein B0H14DRAFT_3132165 [Mycena olivaceomarginata]
MSDSYISSSSCIPKRVQRLKARQSRLKGLVTQQPPNSLAYRILMLPPRPPPTFSPPPVPNIPGKESSHSWINKELFMEALNGGTGGSKTTEPWNTRCKVLILLELAYFNLTDPKKIAAVDLYSSDDRRRSSGLSKSEIALDHCLPVYQDKPLPLIWEPAETLKFPTFCVYKMNASETIVIFKRSQKSPEHLVNIRRDHRQYAVDLASSLTSHEIQEVRAREAGKESAGDTDCLDH